MEGSLCPAMFDEKAINAAKKQFGASVDEFLSKTEVGATTQKGSKENACNYVINFKQNLIDPIFELILETLREDFSGEKVVPISIEAVAAHRDFPKAKAPGIPFNELAIRTNFDAIENGAFKQQKRMWNRVSHGRSVHFPEVTVYKEADRTTNAHIIYEFPLLMYLEEARYVYPMQQAVLDEQFKFPMAVGLEMANGGMKAINEMLRRHPKSHYTTIVWSTFDKVIPPRLIRKAFGVLEDCIGFSKEKLDNEHTLQRKIEHMRNRWKRMINYFINTPIRTLSGKREETMMGLAPGSCWTKLIGSVINAMITRYVIYRITGNLPLDELYFCENAILVTSTDFDLKEMGRLALETYGVELDYDLSYITKDPDIVRFLGYYNSGGTPLKPQDMLIAEFIQPVSSRSTNLQRAAAAFRQMLATFEPSQATKWYKVVLALVEAETLEPFSMADVVAEVKRDLEHFEFLRTLGYDETKITMPVIVDDAVKIELPLHAKRMLTMRQYDIAELERKATMRSDCETANQELKNKNSKKGAASKHFRGTVDQFIFRTEAVAVTQKEPVESALSSDIKLNKHLIDPIFELILETLREDFSGARVVPISIEAVAAHRDFPKTAAPGSPFNELGIKTNFDAIQNDAFDKQRTIWNKIAHRRNRIYRPVIPVPDVLVYAETELTDQTLTKATVKYEFPLLVYLEEARCVYPLQQAIIDGQYKFPMAVGLEMANGGMKAINEMLQRHPESHFTTIVWSTFDKVMPPWLIKNAFAILADSVDFMQELWDDGHIKARKYRDMRFRWQRMVEYFIYTPIQTLSGNRQETMLGLAPGSCWTKLIGSVINAMITRYVIYRITGKLPLDELYLCENAILVTTTDFELKEMARLAFEIFGIKLDNDLSYTTKDPDKVRFLGYYNCGGTPLKPQDMIDFTRSESSSSTNLEEAAAAFCQLLATFEPCQATKWYKVVLSLLEAETVKPFTMADVVEQVKTNSQHLEFLRTLGYDETKIKMPVIVDGAVKIELPLHAKRILPMRQYVIAELERKAKMRKEKGQQGGVKRKFFNKQAKGCSAKTKT